MIVLDTNVLSEALKPLPEAAVMRWLGEQKPGVVFTTAITQAEILYGVESLPPGRRRNRLQAAVERLFTDEFPERVLAFDSDAALIYPKIVVKRARLGRPISHFDAMIAAVCQSRNATIATRNSSDFEGCGLTIVNPRIEQ